MENYVRLILFSFVLMLIGSCTEEPEALPDPGDSLSDIEKKLMGKWVYDNIHIEPKEDPILALSVHDHANFSMEPGFGDLNANGGERARLFRRRVEYSAQKTYQLQWLDRGQYALGTENDLNWQPNFGYWKIEKWGDEFFIVHNNATAYETRYRIIGITEDKLVRQSVRYMSDDGRIYQSGDSVRFTETFTKPDTKLTEPSISDHFNLEVIPIPVRFGYHVAKISYSNDAINGLESIKLDFPGNIQGPNIWGGVIWWPREYILEEIQFSLHQYSNGHLVFAIKHEESLANIEIKLESGNVNIPTLNLKDFTSKSLKNGWMEYKIPIIKFSELGLNLEEINVPFGLWNPTTMSGDPFIGEILVDNIHFEK